MLKVKLILAMGLVVIAGIFLCAIAEAQGITTNVRKTESIGYNTKLSDISREGTSLKTVEKGIVYFDEVLDNPERKEEISIGDFLILKDVSQAQSNIRIELSAGLSLISESNSVLPYWNNGWKVGGSISYAVSQNIQLLAGVGYSRFEYSGQDETPPWDRYIQPGYSRFEYSGGGPNLAVPLALGFRRDIAGDASHIYEASVGVRLLSDRFVKPFISVRVGILYTQVGEIRITEWMEQNPQNKFTYVYRSSGIGFSKPFASTGFGVDVPIGSKLNILLEGMFTVTFDLAQLYYPICATLQLEL